MNYSFGSATPPDYAQRLGRRLVIVITGAAGAGHMLKLTGEEIAR